MTRCAPERRSRRQRRRRRQRPGCHTRFAAPVPLAAGRRRQARLQRPDDAGRGSAGLRSVRRQAAPAWQHAAAAHCCGRLWGNSPGRPDVGGAKATARQSVFNPDRSSATPGRWAVVCTCSFRVSSEPLLGRALPMLIAHGLPAVLQALQECGCPATRWPPEQLLPQQQV